MPKLFLVRILVPFLLLFAFVRPTPAFDFLPDFFGTKVPDGKLVFDGGNRQYVKIVKRGKGTPGQNDQPIQIRAEQLRMVLESIKTRKDTGLISEQMEDVPVFVPSEIAVLSTSLSRGLAQAGPDEDVIFQVVGMHPGALSKEAQGITGRVFYQGGRLNLIFGDVHKSIEGSGEQKQRNVAAGCGDCPVDERLNPFKIASRTSAGKVDDPIAIIDGLAFKTYDGKIRPDWLVLDVPKIVASIERAKNKLPPGLEKERVRARQEAAKANIERLQMREEMARMRKQMEDLKNGTDTRSVEERLATLQDLKKKGLISDEEFEARRKQILNNL